MSDVNWLDRLQVEDPTGRIDGVCQFMEFWLGDRSEAYGEPDSVLRTIQLPKPLRQLYGFAGRWPHWREWRDVSNVVPALAHNDYLLRATKLDEEDDGKITFLIESQACWRCQTLPSGDDPPVWVTTYHNDKEQQRQVCESLSRFLVTFVVGELFCGARYYNYDESFDRLFEAHRDEATPLLVNGSYVYDSRSCFWLWRNILVAGDPFDDPPNQDYRYGFSAMREDAIDFLLRNQSPVDGVFIEHGRWGLELGPDGSGTMVYTDGNRKERQVLPPQSLPFEPTVQSLLSATEDELAFMGEPSVAFMRSAQPGATPRRVHDVAVVKSVFAAALGTKSGEFLELFRRNWP